MAATPTPTLMQHVKVTESGASPTAGSPSSGASPTASSPSLRHCRCDNVRHKDLPESLPLDTNVQGTDRNTQRKDPLPAEPLIQACLPKIVQLQRCLEESLVRPYPPEIVEHPGGQGAIMPTLFPLQPSFKGTTINSQEA